MLTITPWPLGRDHLPGGLAASDEDPAQVDLMGEIPQFFGFAEHRDHRIDAGVVDPDVQ
jgi:hypothetical protein